MAKIVEDAPITTSFKGNLPWIMVGSIILFLIHRLAINTGAKPPQTGSFPTTIVVVTLVVMLAVAAGLYVYFKKHQN